jgi:hypothetical protein
MAHAELLVNAKTGQIEDANSYLTQMLGYSHDAALLTKRGSRG